MGSAITAASSSLFIGSTLDLLSFSPRAPSTHAQLDARPRLNLDEPRGAPVAQRDLGDNGETESRATGATRTGRVGPGKALEEPGTLGDVDALTVVAHHNEGVVVVVVRVESQLALGVAHGVVHHIANHPLEHGGITQDAG